MCYRKETSHIFHLEKRWKVYEAPLDAIVDAEQRQHVGENDTPSPALKANRYINFLVSFCVILN